MLQGGRYVSVLGTVREQCRTVAATVKVGAAAPNAELSRAIVGRWNYYKASRPTVRIQGSVTKNLTFQANGRFAYQAATYIPDMPSDVNPITEYAGVWRIEGNTLYCRTDRGAAATYTVELVERGRVLNVGGDLYVRE